MLPVLFWESQGPPWRMTGPRGVLILDPGYLFNNICFLGAILSTTRVPIFKCFSLFLCFSDYHTMLPINYFYFFFHPSLVSINPSYPWKYFLNAIKVANLVIIALTFVGNVCDRRSWGILLLYTGAKWIELILAWKSPKV